MFLRRCYELPLIFSHLSKIQAANDEILNNIATDCIIERGKQISPEFATCTNLICNIINDDDAVSASIITRNYGPESFLAGYIPLKKKQYLMNLP